MTVFFHLILFAIFCLILLKSSQILVTSLTRLSLLFKVSEFVVSFLLMAFATSVPELFVGIMSALANEQNLSLGTVIGSNIADLTFVAGIAAILAKNIRVGGVIKKFDILYMIIVASLPMILSLDGKLSRFDGGALLAVYLFYLLVLFTQRGRFVRPLHERLKDGKSRKSELFKFLVGIIGLLIGARLVVYFADIFTKEMGLHLVEVGLFLVAIGTSLPELVFETKAILTHHTGLLLGDLLGSVATNSSLVLGVTALISPIVIQDFAVVQTSFVFLILVMAFFAIFARSKSRISWHEGIALVILYIFFIVIELAEMT